MLKNSIVILYKDKHPHKKAAKISSLTALIALF